MHRTVLAIVAGFLAMFSLEGCSAMTKDIKIALSITDDQGRPVSYATVWGYVLPRENQLAIDGEELWKLTTSYQSSFEFATPFNRIVPTLQVFPMGNANGEALLVVDYQALEGADSVRPAIMKVGFSVMKKGYLPSRIDFSIREESSLSAAVVLKRDPSQKIEAEPYLVEFERIRWELSDTSHNESISQDAHQRVEGLRHAMETAADMAIAAGDQAAAARIYARMQYLPTVQILDGKAAGFSQADPYSEVSSAYMVKAYELNPNNSYVASKYLFKYGADNFSDYISGKASSQQKKLFSDYLYKLDRFMSENGSQVWPNFHQLYAHWKMKR